MEDTWFVTHLLDRQLECHDPRHEHAVLLCVELSHLQATQVVNRGDFADPHTSDHLRISCSAVCAQRRVARPDAYGNNTVAGHSTMDSKGVF